MKPHNCEFIFRLPGKPRQKCGLPLSSEVHCILHAPTPDPNDYLRLLCSEIQNPDHWLEGISCRDSLIGINLSGAKMPRAVFEGIRLESISLDEANLEGAVFRSATLKNVTFFNSNLKDAIFDRANFITERECSVDFRDAELGGVSFHGADLSDVRLEGVHFSKPTKVSYLLNAPICEVRNGDWETAASVYVALGKRAREDWDILSEDLATFAAMTCRHRWVIGAGPMGKSYLTNWIVPTIKSRLRGLWWYSQRIVWGYGHKPLRLVSQMLAMILLFSGLFTLLNYSRRGNIGSSILDGALLSMQSFTTVTYGKSIPADKLSEVLGTLEAFLGTILVSLLVVSLAARFMRKI